MQDLAHLPSFISLRDHCPEVPVVWYVWVVLHMLSCLYLWQDYKFRFSYSDTSGNGVYVHSSLFNKIDIFLILLSFFSITIWALWGQWVWCFCLFFILFSLLLEEFLVQKNNIVKYLLLSKLLTLLEYSTVLNLSWLPKDPLWLHSNLMGWYPFWVSHVQTLHLLNTLILIPDSFLWNGKNKLFKVLKINHKS